MLNAEILIHAFTFIILGYWNAFCVNQMKVNFHWNLTVNLKVLECVIMGHLILHFIYTYIFMYMYICIWPLTDTSNIFETSSVVQKLMAFTLSFLSSN